MAETANRVIKNTGYLYLKMAITVFISLYTTRLILNSLYIFTKRVPENKEYFKVLSNSNINHSK